MAGRTSAGIGVGIAITVLAVLSAALFVLTMVFYSQKQAADREIAAARGRNDLFIRDVEREMPTVREVIQQARGKSAVAHLMEQQSLVMRTVSGRPDMSVTDMQTQAGALLSQGESLMGRIRSQASKIQELERQVANAEASRRSAQQDAQAEADRIGRIEREAQATIADLTSQIGDYQGRINMYRDNVDTLEVQMREQIERRTDSHTQRERALSERLSRLQTENALLQDQVASLRGVRSGDTLRPMAEEALVDGRVVEIRPGSNEVVISLGRQDKIQLGMTFSVYADASRLRPDPTTGEYNEGKAVVEVIDIDRDTSRARIVRESRGNPITRGDVIANPVYDPKKEYRFVVYGNFDVNRDGLATREEGEDLKSLIRSWGGIVQSDLTGGVDFLVLGQKPVLPPQPGPDAPLEVLQEYVRLQTVVSNYDQLFARAASTSIPVLNENRLYTLIGSIPD